MVRLISKDILEINPGEVVEEITVIKRIFFMNFKIVYRKVHGTIFRYKNGRYRELSLLSYMGVSNYFKIPFE
jgi:hypothetical protein